ncbi:cupin-like domain-containing protein [Roseovarius sp. S1116L3]|uniref:cupin-like domain-containing protein n=1 Tax=Roseovarius roseus TaxID=3342636 RepID=UPI003727F26D
MYKVYRNVLGPKVNRAIYDFALEQSPKYSRSKVNSTSSAYSDWRRSTLIYGEDIERAAGPVETFVRQNLVTVLQDISLAPFDVSGLEVQLTSHNDGEYFHWHTDNGSPKTASRTLTFVYYFHSIPKSFEGGELILYDDDGSSVAVAPDNDTIVFFPSGTKHEVRTISCPSKRFCDGRFTINGWVHRPRMRRSTDYFDAKIFGSRKAPGHSKPFASARPIHSESRERGEDETRQLQDYAAGMFFALGDLRQGSGTRPELQICVDIDAQSFFRDFYFKNTPVLIKGAIASSPAVRDWSLEYLEREFGDVSVPITSGRAQNADYELNFAKSVEQTTMRDLVHRLREEPESNDYYLVARNNALAHPALRPLRDQITPPSDIIRTEDERAAAVKLWLGPKGTVTPLHYDKHSILFAQIMGRKNFKLISPFDAPSLAMRQRYYSEIDLREPDLGRHPNFAQVAVLDAIVEPGDVLFLPVGWWHWAEALDISASATFSSFRVENGNTILRLPGVDRD